MDCSILVVVKVGRYNIVCFDKELVEKGGGILRIVWKMSFYLFYKICFYEEKSLRYVFWGSI